jgi:hypothetical protein
MEGQEALVCKLFTQKEQTTSRQDQMKNNLDRF